MCVCVCVCVCVFEFNYMTFGASLVSQMVKNLPAMQEAWIWSLGWEDPMETGLVTFSSILTWRIPWTGEPGRLQSMELQRVRHDWATNYKHIQTYTYTTFEGREDFFSILHLWFHHMLYKYWLKEEGGKVFAGALSSSKIWHQLWLSTSSDWFSVVASGVLQGRPLVSPKYNQLMQSFCILKPEFWNKAAGYTSDEYLDLNFILFFTIVNEEKILWTVGCIATFLRVPGASLTLRIC